MSNHEISDEGLPAWIWVIALLTGWIGFVLALVQILVNKNKAPRRSKQAVILSIICFITSIVYTFVMLG